MSAAKLLARVEKVKRTGRNRWTACCPAHDDHNPSLVIRELDDGRLLVHCFAGCAVHEVVGAIGLDLSDLFPTREIEDGKGKPEGRPFPAIDILRCIASEALIVMLAAKSLLAAPLSEVDHKRLILAVTRIYQAMDAGGVSHVK